MSLALSLREYKNSFVFYTNIKNCRLDDQSLISLIEFVEIHEINLIFIP